MKKIVTNQFFKKLKYHIRFSLSLIKEKLVDIKEYLFGYYDEEHKIGSRGIIGSTWYSFKYSVYSFFKFLPVIIKWRHWDPHYELLLLRRSLHLKEKKWANLDLVLPYEGMEKDHATLQTMISLLDDYLEHNDYDALQKFLKLYTKKGIYIAD